MLQVILSIVNTIMTAFLLVGVYLAYRSLRSDHDQRRRLFTMKLYDAWRQVLDQGSSRETLEMLRSGLISDSDMAYIARGQAVPEKFSQAESHRIRKDFAGIMNLFEQVCVAALDNVGDREMIARCFAGPITQNARRLNRFREEWENCDLRSGWPVIYFVINELWADPIHAKGRPEQPRGRGLPPTSLRRAKSPDRLG